MPTLIGHWASHQLQDNQINHILYFIRDNLFPIRYISPGFISPISRRRTYLCLTKLSSQLFEHLVQFARLQILWKVTRRPFSFWLCLWFVTVTFWFKYVNSSLLHMIFLSCPGGVEDELRTSWCWTLQ